jgi:adenylate cyclase
MARDQRRLAAVLDADVVGYSRLMGRDESGTVSRLRDHRVRRLEPLLARHGGRLVKLTGDGVLVEFPSAVDALAAAIEFQQIMLDANRGQPENMAIVFRIGIHLGDLIVDGDDLYGDAVNIAARLQEQAPAGGILVSRTVKEAVAGRMKATFEDRGRLELKNIERPVPAFRVIWDPGDWPVSTLAADATATDPAVRVTSAGRPSTSARASLGFLRSKRIAIWAAVALAGCILLASAGYLAFAPRPPLAIAEPSTQSQSSVSAAKPSSVSPLADNPSIAVLAFRNLSGDPEREYFADGMTEEIITTLSRIPGFVVIARNSSFSYKGRSVDVRQVGSELGVRYVVDGSIRIAGNTLRISCSLIDATSGKHIWAERYDGTMENVFDLQDRITSSIVATIQPEVQRAEIARAQAKPTNNLTAYDLYLRAVAASREDTQETSDQTLELLDRAIAADKKLSAAYGLAVGAYLTRLTHNWGSRDEALARAYEAAKIAVEVGNDDPVALTLGGFGLAFFGARPEEGLTHIQHALTLNPNYLLAWRLAGAVSWMTGRHEKSIQYYERAMQLSPRDPQSFDAYSGISYPYFFLGQYKAAISWSERALRDKPRYVPALLSRLAALAMEGSHSGEIQTALRQLEAASHFPASISAILYVLPLYSRSDRELFETALRKAGVPD